MWPRQHGKTQDIYEYQIWGAEEIQEELKQKLLTQYGKKLQHWQVKILESLIS